MVLFEGSNAQVGVQSRFTKTLMRCVSSVTLSVWFNDGSLDVFRTTRGLRQGDPISPNLFLLAIEGLSCSMKANGGVKGISVAPSAPSVNHLLFADDNLLFFEANEASATHINEQLIKYCNDYGQQVNMEKSSIFFGKGVAALTRDSIKNILLVHNESLSEKYLGLPSDVGRAKEGSFKYLNDQIWKKVQEWMEKCLSAGEGGANKICGTIHTHLFDGLL